MPELASRLESHGKSSKADISAHGAAFDDLGIDIARIESSDTDQNYLISSARQILDKFSEAESRFIYGLGDQPPSIELDKVLSAMLSHAQDCGGHEGLRYIASAIVACRERSQCNGGVAEFNLLESMGITMITQFLFIFKARWLASEDWLGATFDEYDPRYYSGFGKRNISKSEERFRLKLLIRQGFACFLSKDGADFTFPPIFLDPNLSCGFLVQRQIFRWPTAVAEDGSESCKSATRSFNILKKFTRISANNLGELKNTINDPSNGVMLFLHLHKEFDQLKWCLQPTEVENEYNLKFHYPASDTLEYLRPALDAERVVFTDRSQESYSRMGSIERFPDPIPLPDRHLISICASIGEILHKSGAGLFLEELLPPLSRNPFPIIVHSWQELEEGLRNSFRIRHYLHG